MFNLFKRKPPTDPPTERQLNYAKKLGIQVTPDMSKSDVSDAISLAESKAPALARQREHVKESRATKKHSPELLEAEQQWENLSTANKWMIAVYLSGKTKKFDVIRINGAYITDKSQLRIEGEAGKVKKDRTLGPIVDLNRAVDIPREKLLWHEVINEIEIEDVDVFNAAMKRAEQAAARL